MAKPLLDGEFMFPTEYLCEQSFKGKEVTLTIKDIFKDDIPLKGTGKTKNETIITFKETDKKMVCKPTNGGLIIQATGEIEARDWVGHRIILYPTTCQFKKDPNYPCYRVRPYPPTNKKQSPAEKGADTSVDTSAPTVLQQIQKLLTGKTVLADDYEYAVKLSQLQVPELIQLMADAGDYKGAIKKLIDMYVERNQEVTG